MRSLLGTAATNLELLVQCHKEGAGHAELRRADPDAGPSRIS